MHRLDPAIYFGLLPFFKKNQFFGRFQRHSRLISRLCLGIFLAVLIPAAAGFVCAEPDEPLPYNTLVSDLGQTLEESLKAEQNSLTGFKSHLARAEREQIYFTAAVNGYQLRLTSYGNLLLSAGVDAPALQKTRAEIKSSLVEVQKMLDEITPATSTFAAESRTLDQQKQLVEKQRSELAGITTQEKNNEIPRSLDKKAKTLFDTLKEKQVLVEKLNQMYQKREQDLAQIKTALSSLESQFDTAIEQKKTKNLFERNKEVFKFEAFKNVQDELQRLLDQATGLLRGDFWFQGGQKLWQSAGLVAVSFIFVLCGAFFILLRLKAPVSRLRHHVALEPLGRWHKVAVELLSLSVLPGGMALALFLYSRLDTMFLVVPLLEAASLLLLVFLMVRWVEQAFAHDGVKAGIGETTARSLVRLCRGIALFFLAYMPVYYSLGAGAGILVVLRMTGAFGMLVWVIIAWRRIIFSDIAAAADLADRKRVVASLGFKYLLTTICSVALVLDMIGYGSLCVHWLLAWAKCAVIVFWWVLFFALIREWDRYYREKSNRNKNEFLYDDYPVQWLMIRAGQLLALVSFLTALLLAWGNHQTVLGRFYQTLAHPISIGNMNFSLLGAMYAAFVLMITYAVTRMWKWLFQSKFLSRSGMALGLQDSITTITVYVIWIFGILTCLHVFGLNTASLAVAFGALGIGLGFGLQNIFNNFISGIILLFERPIQVGDDVEVNGTWAQVKKINVRSTVVQTYDNASLIIPNADFISNQVTNWSFKDKRLRRQIEVGVAYGSDVQLVRQTLLDIAAATPKVLRYPRPDVLFRDFGDSALIFRLRVWTDIDNMLVVETDIRFSIDRLFREKNIEISFPQRDIHIRSVTDMLCQNPGTKDRQNQDETPPDEKQLENQADSGT